MIDDHHDFHRAWLLIDQVATDALVQTRQERRFRVSEEHDSGERVKVPPLSRTAGGGQ